VFLSYSAVLPKAQFGGSLVGATNLETYANYFYNDSSQTIFPPFGYYFSDPTGIDLSDPATFKGKEQYTSTATFEKDGTAILAAKVSIKMMGVLPYVAYSKQILNLTDDGFSTEIVGDELEIVPVTDLAYAKPGEPIKFKMLYNGSPLAGVKAEWADSESPIVDPDTNAAKNIVGLDEPTDVDGIFTYTPRIAGTHALAIPETTSKSLPGFSGTYYSCTFLFEVEEAKEETSSSGGGGCNVGSLSFLPLIAGVFLVKRRRRDKYK
jgi:hypothetical protein